MPPTLPRTPATSNLLPALAAAKVLVILRTDAIGDNVLASAMLRPLRTALPQTRIVYACQDRVADLFTSCPLVDDVLTFNRGWAYADERYRQELGQRLRNAGAEVVLNPMVTREPLADALMRELAQRPQTVRIGFASGQAASADEPYTHVIDRTQDGPAEPLELAQTAAFLRAIGIAPPGVPELWLTADDTRFAADFFAERALDPARSIVLFAGSLGEYKMNHHWGDALAAAVPEANVISVGAAHEYRLHQELLRRFPATHVNLCGRTSLRQTAALLKRVPLAVGADTASAHLACAVGTPNVVVLGGGHFGRFLPWSPLTTAACLPLECFRCDWKCRHERFHCITDVSAFTLAAAIRLGLSAASDKPRLVVQAASTSGENAPRRSDVRAWIDAARVEVIAAPPEAPSPSLTPLRIAPKPPHSPAHQFRATAIVSTYNSEHLMRGCLQDLVAQTLFAKNQLEILVIDSASPGNERAIVEECQRTHGAERIRYLRTPARETLYAAWNRGIDASRGKYLTNANTDDRHHPEMLEILAAALDARPDCALAYADSDVTHDQNASWADARRAKHLDWPEFSRDGLFAANFAGPHPMWRREAHDEAGYFDAGMISAGDYEFWLRLALQRPFLHVPRRLGLYLENPRSISLGNAGLSWYEARVARERYWKPEWGENPGACQIVEAFRNLAAQAAELARDTRVALFGAGQHTRRNLERFISALQPRLKIVAVLDDRAPEGAPAGVGEWPLVHPSRHREFNVQAVIVSSDTYEAQLCERAKSILDVPVLTIYRPELGRPTHNPVLGHI